MRRIFWVVLVSCAAAAFVVPLRLALVANREYVQGYWATVTDGKEEGDFAWKSPAGRTRRGPIEGEPADGVWDEEGVGTSDITGDRVWVARAGDAHRVPPPRSRMVVGYGGAGLVAGVACYVVWVRREDRRVAASAS
ncbi:MULTISPECIES: hypothetical protein [unclassified Streptomyces]|uniref:hypothetical protein n=1 Tax=unclassified Streptomyces TaxID=2593676 RepID=UPI000DBA7A80|nr:MULTISPECIES: hypothetical protein [unclassified Streptomyces]MYT68157.1 hypothetical protein [Streptomyces sp. SID8367]